TRHASVAVDRPVEGRAHAGAWRAARRTRGIGGSGRGGEQASRSAQGRGGGSAMGRETTGRLVDEPEGATPATPPAPPARRGGAAAPRAERGGRASLGELVGQSHLVGEGAPLRRLMAGKKALPSLILWGGPGTGKTTLARLLAAQAGAEFVPLSAVFSGVR